MAPTAVALLAPEDPTTTYKHPRIDAIALHDPNGNPITVGQLFVRYIAQGNYIDTAAAASGVPTITVRQWLRKGQEVHERRASGVKGDQFTAHQRRCERFAIAVAHASSLAEVRMIDALDQLATGARTTTITRRWVETYDTDGNLLDRTQAEVTEKVVHHPPDRRVIAWKAERRWPGNWRPRPIGEPTDATDIDDPMAPADDPLAEFDRTLTGITDRKQESLAALADAGIYLPEHGGQHAPTDPAVIDVPSTGPDDTPL